MENKINIAEILKKCPKGTELECTFYNGVVRFEKIIDDSKYPIEISVTYNDKTNYNTLTEYGTLYPTPFHKCIISPKDGVSWEEFDTEIEKQKLFEILKKKGYEWNAETKTLYKLPKFEDGELL